MLEKGVKGDAQYLSQQLNISTRTLYRLLTYIEEIEKVSIEYNNAQKYYKISY